MWKLILSCATISIASSVALADSYVNGHIRRDGTYVQPHYRSNADGNTFNNYSTRGNVNPYTGQRGYKDPYNSGNSYGSSNNYGYGLYGSQRR